MEFALFYVVLEKQLFHINYIYQLIGKLNLTYFAIDSFYLIRSLLSKKHSIIDKGNYNSVLANKIYSKFYSKNLKKCINNKDACERNFLNLLNAFKNVVEKNNSINSTYNGIAFTVDILDNNPDKIRLFALRSFGESLYHSVTDACLEFGYKNI